MRLSIEAKIPDYFGFVCTKGERMQYLDNDIPLEVDIQEGEEVMLSQEKCMSLKEKILTALIAIVTVPLQIATFLVERDWERDVIPYRIQIRIKPTANAKCTLYVEEPQVRFHRPIVSIIGDNIEYEVVNIDPWPHAFDIACYRFMCKLMVLMILLIVVFGILAVVASINRLQMAFNITVVTLLAMACVVVFLIHYNYKKCSALKADFLTMHL